jgi:sporulation protein YlmC with PRC-barrel domain
MALGCSIGIGTASAASAEQARQDRVAADAAKVSPPQTGRADVTAETVRTYENLRVSRLIEMFVRTPANEKLGQVKDVIVDLDKARVPYAVLEFDGEIFAAKKLFVYPLTTFKPSVGGEHLVLAVEKGKLAAAPGFSTDQWPNWHARSKEIDRHFGLSAPDDAKPSTHLVRASTYLGSEVRDSQGKKAGELVELVVRLKTGGIHYAVIAFDQPWSMDDKLVAVPLRAFRIGDEGRLQVNVSRDVIARAPSISRSEWPRTNLSQDAWIGQVDRYALSMVTPPAQPERKAPQSR